MPEPRSQARSLLLLRHGRTAWNHAMRIQGHTDVDLDETGHAQARAAADAVATLRPARVWSSDLARARSTASYVERACGLEARPEPRLREYALGEREGVLHADYAVEHPEEFARFRGGDFGVVPGGERTPEVAERMHGALTDLLDVTAPGEVSVAVTHGAALRVGLAVCLGWDAAVVRGLGGVANCGWAVLTEPRTGAGLRLTAYNRVTPGFHSATRGG